MDKKEPSVRIIIADDHTIFRLILFALISALGFVFLFLLASLFFLAFSKG